MAISFRSLIYRNSVSKQRRQVITGNSKTLFEGTEAGTYVLQFKDQICPLFRPAYELTGKGAINNRLSELFLSRLNEMGIETHFIKRLNMSEQLVKSAEAIPLRLTVHNAAVDQLAQRLGLEEPHILAMPIMELSLKSRELNYPVISDQHIEAFQWAQTDEVEDMMVIAQRVNDFLSGQFYALGLRLLSFSLEFGRVYQGDFYDETRLVIIDEISPDTCAILDLKSGERLDGLCKENHEAQVIAECYQEVAKRFGILEEGGPIDLRDPIIFVGEVQSTDGEIEGSEITLTPLIDSSVLAFTQKDKVPLADDDSGDTEKRN